MEEITLIANSGIHFKTIEVNIDLNQPLAIQGNTLRYTFLETTDFLNGGRVKFDICSSLNGQYASVPYLEANNLIAHQPNGMVDLDVFGVPKIKPGTAMAVQQAYAVGAPQLMNINSLSSLSFNVKTVTDGGNVQINSKTGFELLLGKWLPMPMYEYDNYGQSTKYPIGWCRVRIDEIGAGADGQTKRYRFTWAFDTLLADDIVEASIRPSFLLGAGENKKYGICNRPDLLLGGFLNIPDGHNDAPIGDYLASLWNINLNAATQHRYKFLAYYVYLINFIRLCGAAPSVTLYHKKDRQIPVDMSIDIGNSRTCAVLFENGDFTKAHMLRIRDLSQPWISYENAFDMRVVFRKADFGGDLTLGKHLFQWNSLVRVGEEAKHLVYHSLEGNYVSERTTNYSSPKRYLWDDRLFEDKWELMVEEDDPTNMQVAPQIYMDGFTDYFDNDGTFLNAPKPIDLFNLGQNNKQCHYSRRSLMTFVMVEILQHAVNCINSAEFRGHDGQTDCYRYLRNIIVTCPTAMPLEEQYVLRKAAKDASVLLRKLTPTLPDMTITPDPDMLKPQNADGNGQPNRGWLYDEAFASQLVFLYAELQKRYGGQADHFFRLKGHQREETRKYHLADHSLTIGTIDIGAGTTDVMITVYGQRGQGKIVPIPIYYDSFNTAGDDILYNIISQVILEGPSGTSTTIGNITSVLTNRILKMTPDELLSIPRVANTNEYRASVENIQKETNEEKVIELKKHLIYNLMRHFFSNDSAVQSAKDRRCRVDFCTQVTHPMSQFFLELLNKKRPTRVYSYDEIFPKNKPAQYLLNHFQYHFGFRFEDLLWRFDPEEVAKVVKNTMEPIAKALSQLIFRYNCDFLVLSGRPTKLEPLVELFQKNIPVDPSRIIRLDNYRVGDWFPLADKEGHFLEDQKAVVAVGAEVGRLASSSGFKGLVLDFSVLGAEMGSTAHYLGIYDENQKTVRDPILTPNTVLAELKDTNVFPCYIGCKQFDSPKYESRPLFALYNKSGVSPLNIRLQRQYFNDREYVWVDEVTDNAGNTLPADTVDFRLQTMASEGSFWMEKGAFTLTLQDR